MKPVLSSYGCYSCRYRVRGLVFVGRGAEGPRHWRCLSQWRRPRCGADRYLFASTATAWVFQRRRWVEHLPVSQGQVGFSSCLREARLVAMQGESMPVGRSTASGSAPSSAATSAASSAAPSRVSSHTALNLLAEAAPTLPAFDTDLLAEKLLQSVRPGPPSGPSSIANRCRENQESVLDNSLARLLMIRSDIAAHAQCATNTMQPPHPFGRQPLLGSVASTLNRRLTGTSIGTGTDMQQQ